ncbi:hypothetical protein [Desulfosporosinus sp. OT]|uniref:hypothetical protein n=1 Tax=Desulfosporosinus sp. OT TaxID=913865 RepID=UPI000223A8AE|nr:hypothetical protein [Desulfosporosinus sp. OT]EGW40492.1 hypothetical protein DOT_1564 [Desulfosporosinus sp. OT]
MAKHGRSKNALNAVNISTLIAMVARTSKYAFGLIMPSELYQNVSEKELVDEIFWYVCL